MKQFSLEEYLADPSKEIITRDGRKVRRILCTDARGVYPVIALTEYDDTSDCAYSYTRNGRYHISEPCGQDLFFVPKKKEGWLNVYGGEAGVYSLGHIYSDKKTAEASIHGNPIDLGDYIATAKIEWEE